MRKTVCNCDLCGVDVGDTSKFIWVKFLNTKCEKDGFEVCMDCYRKIKKAIKDIERGITSATTEDDGE